MFGVNIAYQRLPGFIYSEEIAQGCLDTLVLDCWVSGEQGDEAYTGASSPEPLGHLGSFVVMLSGIWEALHMRLY